MGRHEKLKDEEYLVRFMKIYDYLWSEKFLRLMTLLFLLNLIKQACNLNNVELKSNEEFDNDLKNKYEIKYRGLKHMVE